MKSVNKRRRLAMITAIALAALMIIPMIISAVIYFMPRAEAISQKDIDKLKTNAKTLADERAKLKKELNTLKANKASAVEQKKLYDSQIETLGQEIENTNELISELNLAIAERQTALDEAVRDEQHQQELFLARLVSMQRMGDTYWLSTIFEADSFLDIFTRWDAMRAITKRDNELVENLRTAREAIERDKAQLEQDKQDLYTSRKELSAAQIELSELSAESDKLIFDMMSDIADGEKLAAEQEAAEKRAQAEVAKAMEELKKQQEAAKKSTKYVGGEYLWPVPGYSTISSPFGNRIHPIYKVKKFHSGIDIPAAKGTKIVAANSGTIVKRAYNSGYGNYIVIDHGGGQATLYAHQSKFAANLKEGSTVKRGDTIGYVGTTGVSTGNHLHFEIIINGEQINPEPKLRK